MSTLELPEFLILTKKPLHQFHVILYTVPYHNWSWYSQLSLTAIDINKVFSEGFSLAVVIIPNMLHGISR